MYLSTYILAEIKNTQYINMNMQNICMYKICNHLLPKEITEEHEYTSNYHNYHTRHMDKILTIPSCKSVKITTPFSLQRF